MDNTELKKVMQARHSVRTYQEKTLPASVVNALEDQIRKSNAAGGLDIQLITDEPKAFGGRMAHYGKFSGVSNYIALVGPKGNSLDEKLGYYGASLVLLAQTLGLNTCWVGMTYTKVPQAVKVDSGEKLGAVIALGYGVTSGVSHKVKSFAEVTDGMVTAPQWFIDGVEAALLAPTALNQQKFTFGLDKDGKVTLKSGFGFFVKMDLGIVRRFFEIGAGDASFEWAQRL